MAEAQRDQNHVPTLLAVSNVDGVTPVVLWADPVTHRLLVNLAAGDGTVTSVSVVTANGFAGSVANPTTTPAITISTTVTGILKGDGTAISAATAGTDYTALAFKTISVSGQSDIVADTAADTLTIVAGTGMTITTNATTDTLTLSLTTDPAGYATKALDNLASVAINTALLPGVSDSIALGSGTKNWSDLFLGDGAVINFNNGNYTVTHSAGLLTTNGNLSLTTSGVLTTGTIELGAASDTTLSRISGGQAAIEGVQISTISNTVALTNKTITASSNVLGGVTMTLGSDADGDIYYRSSNILTRLAKGTALQHLRMNAGATAPEWGAAGQPWVEVTGATQQMAVNTGYVANRATLVTFTLPATAAVGDVVEIVGVGAGGWQIDQNAGDIVHVGNTSSLAGTGGHTASSNRYDSIRLVCVVANDEWTTASVVGLLTITTS